MGAAGSFLIQPRRRINIKYQQTEIWTPSQCNWMLRY